MSGDEIQPAPQEQPRRRRSPKGDERRQAILVAAMRRFSQDGYQSASFATIAADVGLSLPGLLHYYPSKVDLLLAILSRRDLESVEKLGEDMQSWRSFLLGLPAIVGGNMEMVGVVRAFAILNAESLTRDHPAEDWFCQRALNVRRRMSDLLAAGQAAGEVRQDVVAQDVAAELIAMMDGLQMLWLRMPDSVDMAGIFETYVRRLVGAIETA